MTPETRMVGFLVFHESQDFCDACLAARIGVTPADVRAAILALRGRSSVVLRDRFRCQICRREGEVTRAIGGRTVATKTRLRQRAVRVA